MISRWKSRFKMMGTNEEMFLNYFGEFYVWKNFGGKSVAANFWIFLWVILDAFYHELVPDHPTLGHSWGDMREVGKILSKQLNRGRTRYLIKWKGCHVNRSTWELTENIHPGLFV